MQYKYAFCGDHVEITMQQSDVLSPLRQTELKTIPASLHCTRRNMTIRKETRRRFLSSSSQLFSLRWLSHSPSSSQTALQNISHSDITFFATWLIVCSVNVCSIHFNCGGYYALYTGSDFPTENV